MKNLSEKICLGVCCALILTSVILLIIEGKYLFAVLNYAVAGFVTWLVLALFALFGGKAKYLSVSIIFLWMPAMWIDKVDEWVERQRL